MYIKIHNKKIELIECNTFIKKLKSYKFYLHPIDKGLFLKNRKFLNTYFFCQKVDALFIDKDFNIIRIYHNLKSEKRHICFSAKHLIILPENSCLNLIEGEKVIIEQKNA